MEKKKILITLGCVIGLLLVIGISYAYWSLTFTQTENNVVMTDCFEIEFIEGNAINLSKAYPVSDSDGMKNDPYTFTIKNICDSNAKYQINLETLTPSGKKLPDQYLKANLMESNVSKITSKLESSLNTDPTIEGAVSAYKLYNGILGPNETKEFSLRIWMHSDVTAEMADSMNATYNGKISIITSYYQDNRGTMMSRDMTYAFWREEYSENISDVIIEPTMNAKDTDLFWDISEKKDGSVMSYLVKNENDNSKYDLYIQSEGGVLAPTNSSHLFSMTIEVYLGGGTWDAVCLIDKIKGLEHFDTSNVTDMSSMFANCSNLINLDVSYFDTSNVTDMSSMFANCSNLTNLDVSHFDTSKVTDMSSMFAWCSNLTNIDVSHFDTSNVTDMSFMFAWCSNLDNLDVSHFDTSNVTSMDSMFFRCSSLTNLDVSYFNTSNVTDMSFMFANCSNLINLDVINFNTSNVTSMTHMFYGCESFTNLVLSNFNTGKVTNMAWMFAGCENLENLNLGFFEVTNINQSSAIFDGVPNTAIVKVRSENTKNWVLSQKSDLNVVVEA